jgi:hypothetical protein
MGFLIGILWDFVGTLLDFLRSLEVLYMGISKTLKGILKRTLENNPKAPITASVTQDFLFYQTEHEWKVSRFS